MNIYMIGHASIFVETQDCRILMDPVFWDPHQEGLLEVCPKRDVLHELLPEFDVLIISHRHLDHFDIRSLASLPKTVDVLIPDDDLLKTFLRKLGYSRISPLPDFAEVKLGSTSLLTTRSENRVPEFGVLFADESGVCWNQVDTKISIDTIGVVQSHHSQIALLLTTWQPLLEVNFQFNRDISFPHTKYNELLENVRLVRPLAVTPASNGFKYTGDTSWMNHVVFPVTREQFCKDVRLVYPAIADNVFPLDPGDVLSFDAGTFRHSKGTCNFVRMIEDDRECLDFAPVLTGSELIDKNPDDFDLDQMCRSVKEELVYTLPKFIMDNKNSLFSEHCRWGIIYQVEVVFPNSHEKWHFDFSEEIIKARDGRNPLANVFAYLTASCLYGFLKRIRGWDYALLGAHYRSFKKVYTAGTDGTKRPDETTIKDPLRLRFPYQQLLEGVLEREVEEWSGTEETLALNERKSRLM